MQKLFYVAKNQELNSDSVCTPDMDRFARIDKLNNLLSLGWCIKEFKKENNEEYFILEK